jgi:cytochrome c-type biogenesis protein CcmF
MRSRPQRYGGLFVHVGVAVMAISITASMGYKTERDIILNPGERYDIGRFSLNLLDIHEEDHGNYAALRSEVQVFERGTDRELTRLHPERRFYKVNQEATTEVDIRITPREDLYLALAGIEGERSAVLKVFINPLQMWLWVGSVIMLAGMGIVLLPRTVQERGALAFDLFQKQPQSGERSIG